MDEPNQDFETITTRQAKSGKVSFSDPILLRDSSKRQVVVVPFFIPHTDHTELAIKIVSYLKQRPPISWTVIEEKSVSLGEEASRKLLSALQTHLKIAETGEDGSYLVIRVSEGTAQLTAHDPAKVAQALTKVLGQPEIVEHLKNTELSAELLTALRGAIRLGEMRRAVTKLREYLTMGESDEGVYQTWCERHSWAFGNAYVLRDSVRDISPGDRLDLLLPTVIAGYRDIVELKRPDMRVMNWDDAHRNHYFSSDVAKAIGQCHRYLDVLHEVAAKGLRDHPEIVAYHPRAIIVIGRSNDWDESKLRDLHGLNRRLSGIMIMTYDQLLAQGERLIDILSPKQETRQGLQDCSDVWSEGNEDMPF
jgi:sirohydrochlorin ferrochelatase